MACSEFRCALRFCYAKSIRAVMTHALIDDDAHGKDLRRYESIFDKIN